MRLGDGHAPGLMLAAGNALAKTARHRLAAVWLLDASGETSGILIDIAGRRSDRAFLDTLLPAR